MIKKGLVMKLITPIQRPSLFNPWFNFPSWDDDDYNPSHAGTGMNMWEDENHVYVEVAVPGLSEKDIDVHLENNVLSIRGAKEEADKKHEGKKVYSSSMKSSFYYSTTLPSSADSDKVDANLENGVLTLTVGKSEKSKPKKIEVKINKTK